MKKLLIGNAAVARGAYEAGCSIGSSYPGTPSTEITEAMVEYKEVNVEWAPNEKVAAEVCIGAFIGPFFYGLYWKKTTKASVWASFAVGIGLAVLSLGLSLGGVSCKISSNGILWFDFADSIYMGVLAWYCPLPWYLWYLHSQKHRRMWNPCSAAMKER